VERFDAQVEKLGIIRCWRRVANLLPWYRWSGAGAGLPRDGAIAGYGSIKVDRVDIQ
jgi:hypothetical protein